MNRQKRCRELFHFWKIFARKVRKSRVRVVNEIKEKYLGLAGSKTDWRYPGQRSVSKTCKYVFVAHWQILFYIHFVQDYRQIAVD